ncbi:MAG TPA: SDR family oxidoreductase [Verrucomicrobiae bacterium]|nr:SDR family oxidoreductase [Verrucomicrobiae bacterium]
METKGPGIGKWALITGASQGIGYEFTRLFAKDGYNLVLVARDRTRLEEVAAETRASSRATLKVLVKDLASPGAAREILDELDSERIFVSILVNNAGFGFQGRFVDHEIQRDRDLVQVNITALVELARLFLPQMIARREGRILNVASTAAFQPGPFLAMYYASKAFVYSFSCALSQELAGTCVTVTTFCPGLTQSKFHARAGLKRRGGILMMDADRVARIGYRALMRGKPIAIAGILNKLMCAASKASPTWLTARVAGWLNKS